MSDPHFSHPEKTDALFALRVKNSTLNFRALVLKGVRSFFEKQGFLEVETPCRVPSLAPEAHIDAFLSEGWFLQTSPELCMKRMVAAGYERLFQICRCYRKGERGRRHLPEFTMVEWYAVGWDSFQMMAYCEDLVRFAARETGKGERLSYQGRTIRLEKGWPKMTVAEAFERFASVPLDRALAENRFDEVLSSEVEPHLGLEKPVFLHRYPASLGALARLDPKDPSISLRFELYICGIEICNGFHELADPTEQRRRFEAEITLRVAAGKTVSPMPEKFLEALEKMPDCAGNALGFDRLVMLLADAAAVDDVIAFAPEDL